MRRQLIVAAVGLLLMVTVRADASKHRKGPETGGASGGKGSVHGVVRDGALGAGDVVVRLTKGGRSVHSDASGRFTFDGVGAGVVTLVATTRDHRSGRVKFVVHAGETFDVVLALRHPRTHVSRGGVARV